MWACSLYKYINQSKQEHESLDMENPDDVNSHEKYSIIKKVIVSKSA